jgi:SAM-dependent methyltransferase
MTTEPKKKEALQFISKDQYGLEIGPSYNPLAPKQDGWNVDIIDHLSTKELEEKYNAWNVATHRIEHVDYVVKGHQGIYETIGKENVYDFILASHVIEHTPDMISFLQDCEKLLKKGGILSLVVPDKNFCFDIYKPLTTTGQIIQAFLEKRKRHSAGIIYDAHALHVSKNGQCAWPGDTSQEGLTFVHTVEEAKAIMDDFLSSEKYIDVHAWQCTYESFIKIIQDLKKLCLISFSMEYSSPSNGHEFYVSLKKT